MRFVLTYSGALPPNGNPQEKHQIRKTLLPQLKKQWAIDPILSSIAHSGSRNNPGKGTMLDDIAFQYPLVRLPRYPNQDLT